jgi:hypothetical protein
VIGEAPPDIGIRLSKITPPPALELRGAVR